MTNNQLISNIISGISVAALLGIIRLMWGVRRDFRRFMTEHAWLITVTLWNRDKVRQIMAKMGMPIDEAPPDDLPWMKGQR